jgi:hypothetical protein
MQHSIQPQPHPFPAKERTIATRRMIGSYAALRYHVSSGRFMVLVRTDDVYLGVKGSVVFRFHPLASALAPALL